MQPVAPARSCLGVFQRLQNLVPQFLRALEVELAQNLIHIGEIAVNGADRDPGMSGNLCGRDRLHRMI